MGALWHHLITKAPHTTPSIQSTLPSIGGSLPISFLNTVAMEQINYNCPKKGFKPRPTDAFAHESNLTSNKR